MAYVLANADGTSNAKVGDVVVTGGGLYEKTATGSKYLGGVEGLAGGKTKSYSELKDAFSKNYGGWIGGGSSGGSGGSNNGGNNPTPAPEPDIDATEDVNGIWYLNGFDFQGAPTYTSSGDSSAAVKNFFGYIILGLIALVILDRAIS